MKVWCNLTPEQASRYQATVDRQLARIESAPGRDRAARPRRWPPWPSSSRRAITRRICSATARPDGRSGKSARLEEICDEVITGGEGALLHPVRRIRPDAAALPGRPASWLPRPLPASLGSDNSKFRYSIISETTPAPTVLPPSRIAKRSSFSMAMGVIR